MQQLLMDKYFVSDWTVYSLAELSRVAYLYMPLLRENEAPFMAKVVRLADTYRRYGYCTIAGMMRKSG